MESPSDLALSALPALSLVLIVSTWRAWPAEWKEVPAIALAVGVTLGVLVLAVISEQVALGPGRILGTPAALGAVLAVAYVGTLVLLSRRDGVTPHRLAILGAIAAMAGHPVVGWTLMRSVCSFRSAGC